MQCEEANLCQFVKNQKSPTPIFLYTPILFPEELVKIETTYLKLNRHTTLSCFCANFVIYFGKDYLVIKQLAN